MSSSAAIRENCAEQQQWTEPLAKLLLEIKTVGERVRAAGGHELGERAGVAAGPEACAEEEPGRAAGQAAARVPGGNPPLHDRPAGRLRQQRVGA